ncbi:MAG TPA: ATP-binding protein [Nitrospiria bacterium]|nr:ATP-binding protein [Nitrospiria bacterium]
MNFHPDDYREVLNLLVAIFNLIFGVIIYARARKRAAHILFSFISFGIFLWATSMALFLEMIDQNEALRWARILYVPPILIVTSFLMFTYVFPKKPLLFRYKIHGTILVLAGLMAVFTLLPGWVIKGVELNFTNDGKKIIYGPAYWGYVLLIPGYFIWSFGRLYNKQKYANGLKKVQLQFILAGTFISANFGLVTNLILPTFGVFDVNWMGPVFTLIQVGTIAYAIVRHRLMDIRTVFSKTLAYSLLMISALSFYSGIIIVSQKVFQNTLGEKLSILIGAILLALGFDPLKRASEKIIKRLFYRDSYSAQDLLTEMNRTLNSIVDLNKILYSVRTIVMTRLDLDRMAILLLDEKTAQFGLREQSGYDHIPPITFQEPLSCLFQIQKPGLIVVENLQDKENLKPEENAVLTEMEALKTGVIAPIHHENRLIGVYFFGNKRSGDYFTGSDLQLLEIIAVQTGTVIENARLYEKVNFQMEELKKTQMQQLVQAAKLASIGELATSVAHEINNPLTGILGFASLLLKDMDDKDPKKREVRIIESEALRTRTIVHSLLDFARKREPKFEKAQINEVLKATLVLVRHQAELSNIEVVEQFREGLPLSSIDVDQMKQVFINLVKNAFDAMPGSGKLYIKTNLLFIKRPGEEPSESDAGQPGASQALEITFSDTGIGMAPEVVARIFEPFYTTKGEKAGTGLGLPVSYGIIERHGGQIEVQSAPGKGTTFKIKLPVQ